MDQKLAAIGAGDQVLAFRALGIAAVAAPSADEAQRALVRLAGEGCAVIFITEDLAEAIPEAIGRYRSQALPAIIPIPGAAGGTGLGMRRLRANIERAIAADILFQEEG